MKTVFRLAGAALFVSAIFPCAIDNSPLFVPRHRPEKLNSAFVRGKLGILTPTLSEEYKLIAWRYLSGLPLSQQEQVAALSSPGLDGSPKAMEQWRKVRESAGFPVIYFGTAKASRIAPGNFYDNCLEDAFATASGTLADRMQRYPGKQALASWVQAQDQVFENCAGEMPVYPPDPDPGTSDLERADRMYQIAAAHFYAEDFDDAEARFRAIAADARSPWRDTAAYMTGRVLLREGTLTGRTGALEGAVSEMAKIATGPLHDSAQGMIGYINSLQDPASVLKSLSIKLTLSKDETVLNPAMASAAYVLTTTRFAKEVSDPAAPEPFRWVHALESRDSGESLRGWQQSHSDSWLTLALMNAHGNDAATPDLIEAVIKIPVNSPAWDTVSFQSVRLMIERGQKDAARDRLNLFLSGQRRELDSVDNAFRRQRMAIATDYDDFLRWVARRPIGYEEDDFDPGNVDSSPILDTDSVEVFNYFAPVPKLIEAAASSRLPDWPRTQLATSAWTRAYVLGNDEAANRLVPVLGKAYPAWASDLSSFRDAAGEAKRFAGAFLISKHSEFYPEVRSDFRPEAGSDSYGPDWWCAAPLKKDGTAGPAEEVLSRADQAEAGREAEKLHDSGSAQVLLALAIMNWANAHRDDRRVPEALYRLVRLTRLGCRPYPADPANGRISKAAFDLLHRRYPLSEWTKQTPYWFN